MGGGYGRATCKTAHRASRLGKRRRKEECGELDRAEKEEEEDEGRQGG